MGDGRPQHGRSGERGPSSAELGPWWFEFGAVMLVGTAVYLVCAYKLRQLWLMRAETVANGGDRSALAPAEQRQLALQNARWRRCLCQAFSRAPVWPPTRDVEGEGNGDANKLEPRHIRELPDSDAMLADLHIPPLLLHVVEAIRALVFDVNVVGDLVVATSPDGRNVSVSRTALQPNTAGALLARQIIHRGPRATWSARARRSARSTAGGCLTEGGSPGFAETVWPGPRSV